MKPTPPNGISVIIPSYNEAPTIRELVKRIGTALTEAQEPHEIIVVDDHSIDRTARIVKTLAAKYPVRLQVKKGKRGKGFSIMEGSINANFRYIAMIDADLQYPPELLPALLSQAREKGSAVAVRRTYRTTLLRRLISRINAFVFGRILLNIPTDVQSGLKVFHHEVFEHVDKNLIGPWSIDMPLLFTTYELGYTAGSVEFDFQPREAGASRVNLIPTAIEIALGAIRTRFSGRVHKVDVHKGDVMLGTGLAYRRKRYVTHSTLPHEQSALQPLALWQATVIFLLLGLITTGMIVRPLSTAIVLVAILSVIYFLDVFFNLFLVLKSLYNPPELTFTDDELNGLDEAKLPVYTVMCPLYREAAVLPHFLASIDRMSWPKDKLDVLLLLEEDDIETRKAVETLRLPEYIRVLVVPDSLPKTKPKACNYGLMFANGDYIVVYDAEDEPDVMQLKKAYLAFERSPDTIGCMQAKLNYYNPQDNVLTRLFTAEYSLWFDVVLTGLQTINTTIPLGGTSNHFKTVTLRKLHGWDPFNVTEDCDLGARLFQAGYRTAIIDSTTLEEANSDLKNWLRQRSRWIKGYIQTYFVHLRNPVRFFRQYRGHGLIFQLVVGGKIAFMLINPLLWLATIAYFTLYAYVGPTIESVYPSAIFYMAVTSLVFGNFLCLYYYMIGVAKREHWNLVKYIFLVPFYWLMVSVAAGIALIQFMFKPHYWEKTIHGLHLVKPDIRTRQETAIRLPSFAAQGRRLATLIDTVGKEGLSGGVLVASIVVINFINFLYNAYLGRTVSFADFGLISVIGSFVYISQVPVGALGIAMTHQSAYLFGRYGGAVKEFWQETRRKAILVASVVTILWLLVTPFIARFFNEKTLLPFVLFAPVWFITIVNSVDGGYLTGNLQFITIGVVGVLEAAVKLGVTVGLVSSGNTAWVYAAIPISTFVAFALAWWRSAGSPAVKLNEAERTTSAAFPFRFFFTAALVKMSSIGFLVFDVILAKHYLSPENAGRYSLLSLIGKMVFFAGGLFSQFVLPIISREEGAGRKSDTIFLKLLTATAGACTFAFLLLGPLGAWVTPILWGAKVRSVVPLLSVYTFGIALLCLSQTIVIYHQSKKQYLVAYAAFALGLFQIAGFLMFHEIIEDFVFVTAISGVVTLFSMYLLHRYYALVEAAARNFGDFVGLFRKIPEGRPVKGSKLRILVFNWRDIRHVWSGGSEVYIQELAKRWVAAGHQVTVFCGNDGKNKRHEVIHGVRIVRRGGFYFVYFWAFFYYMLRFRGKYDLIIDSENGIPFFTPLYAKEKVYLLIHHVHQEVFRKRLIPPFSWIAQGLERYLMPLVYRNTELITVSPSSKADILEHKLTRREPHIIYNGVDLTTYTPGKKEKTPVILYLGRLTTLKSLSVFIQAAALVVTKIKKIRFIIAGDGPDKRRLEHLVRKLKLETYISFMGHVSEEHKVELYRRAWLFVNPSLIEGWGITTIEANACGAPVIASNVAGLRDAVHNPHSGILVRYGAADEFAKTIIRLVKNTKEREKMSREAMAWAKLFDWQKSADQGIELLYE